MSRRNARHTAFKMLFQMDVGKNTPEMAELTLGEDYAEKRIGTRDLDYVKELVSGVREHLAELDEFISLHSKGWSINRINSMERNILRMSLYEIKYMDGIPFEVSVNEGVELAKVYGDDEGYAFVNGILDKARPENPENPDNTDDIKNPEAVKDNQDN